MRITYNFVIRRLSMWIGLHYSRAFVMNSAGSSRISCSLRKLIQQGSVGSLVRWEIE